MEYLQQIKEKELKYVIKGGTESNIFADNIAEVTYFDFSKANMNEESRVEAVTLVAAACYANPNAVGRETLFNRLEQESLGLPSSSFEFIPVLLSKERVDYILNCYNYVTESDTDRQFPNILTFGTFIGDYLLTNYRALCSDHATLSAFDIIEGKKVEDIRKYFNSETECELMLEKYSVFLSYIDTNTRAQYIRHRKANWQEMSRRYVSGKKVDFEFYNSERMKNFVSHYEDSSEEVSKHYELSTETLETLCVNHYNVAIAAGVLPQEARRIIPQAMYTLVWSGFDNHSLKNFFDLRLDNHAQWEIRRLAEAKLKLIEMDNNESN
jgi:thymidylate synthase (FAD)